MSAPLGAEVGLFYDSSARVLVGEYLRSVSTGRTYLITAARPVLRGPNAGTRQMLRCVVVPQDHPEPGDTVRPIAWYGRNRKARR